MCDSRANQGNTRSNDQKKRSNAAREGRTRENSDPRNLLGPNSEIGRKLKQYYDELVSDDVPDRFADLLSKLEQAEPTGMAVAAETKAEG